MPSNKRNEDDGHRYDGVQCKEGTWTAPPADDFDTTQPQNCILFSEFASSVSRQPEDTEAPFCYVPIATAEEYIMESLPSESRPSHCQFFQWYYGNNSLCTGTSRDNEDSDLGKFWAPYAQVLLIEARETCDKELRSALGLSGNPDIAGVGVSLRNINHSDGSLY